MVDVVVVDDVVFDCCCFFAVTTERKGEGNLYLFKDQGRRKDRTATLDETADTIQMDLILYCIDCELPPIIVVLST